MEVPLHGDLAWLFRVALERTGASGLALAMPGEDGGPMRVAALTAEAEDLDLVTLPGRQSLCEVVMATGRTLAIASLREEAAEGICSLMRAEATRAYLGTPLAAPDGAVLGALALLSDRERIWSKRDRADLERVARLVVLALQALPPGFPVWIGQSEARA